MRQRRKMWVHVHVDLLGDCVSVYVCVCGFTTEYCFSLSPK